MPWKEAYCVLDERIARLEELNAPEKEIVAENHPAVVMVISSWDDRYQSHLAFATSALALAPERYIDFIDIAVKECEGVLALQQVYSGLRKAFDKHFGATLNHAGDVTAYDCMSSIAKELLQSPGPERYAGQALAGSLENYVVKKRLGARKAK